jgi:hypothetical protein
LDGIAAMEEDDIAASIGKLSVYQRYFEGEDIDRFNPERPRPTLKHSNRSFLVEIPSNFDHLNPSEEDAAFIDFQLNQRTKHEKIYTALNISRNQFSYMLSKLKETKRLTHGYRIDDDETLEDLVKSIHLKSGRNEGVEKIWGAFKKIGYRVGRDRISKILRSADPAGTTSRWGNVVKRSSYHSEGPNAVWHHDGCHHLIAYKIVIHGCVDGYSRYSLTSTTNIYRYAIFLEAAPNNLSRTVFDLFVGSFYQYGLPDKVRGDEGIENVLICKFMGFITDAKRPYITGRSVHNTRIERQWRELRASVTHRYAKIFQYLERHDVLDPHSDLDISILHFVYMNALNESLADCASTWNAHQIRTASRQTPENMYPPSWPMNRMPNPIGERSL